MPFPPLPHPGIKSASPALAGRFFTAEPQGSLYAIDESESESHSVLSDSLRHDGLYSPWNSAGHNTEVGSLPPLQGIFPTQGSNPGLPHCISPSLDSLPAEPQGQPRNTGVGSLSLLQRIFLTQEWNRGPLHFGRILYQRS